MTWPNMETVPVGAGDVAIVAEDLNGPVGILWWHLQALQLDVVSLPHLHLAAESLWTDVGLTVCIYDIRRITWRS